jgi:hypothetical protein
LDAQESCQLGNVLSKQVRPCRTRAPSRSAGARSPPRRIFEPLAQTSDDPFGLGEQALIEASRKIGNPALLDLKQAIEARLSRGTERDDGRSPMERVLLEIHETGCREVVHGRLQGLARHSDCPRKLRHRARLAASPNQFQQTQPRASHAKPDKQRIS